MEHHGAVQAHTQLPPPVSTFLQCFDPPITHEAPGELQAVPEVHVVPLEDFSPLAGCPMHPASPPGQVSHLGQTDWQPTTIANNPNKRIRPLTVATVPIPVITDLLVYVLPCRYLRCSFLSFLVSDVLPRFFTTKLLILFVEVFCHWGKLLK